MSVVLVTVLAPCAHTCTRVRRCFPFAVQVAVDMQCNEVSNTAARHHHRYLSSHTVTRLGCRASIVGQFGRRTQGSCAENS